MITIPSTDDAKVFFGASVEIDAAGTYTLNQQKYLQDTTASVEGPVADGTPVTRALEDYEVAAIEAAYEPVLQQIVDGTLPNPNVGGGNATGTNDN